MQFWTITEVQVLDNGAKVSQAFVRETYNEALSVYYSSLAAGAINGIPYHATYLIDSKRGVKLANIYDRTDELKKAEESEATE